MPRTLHILPSLTALRWPGRPGRPGRPGWPGRHGPDIRNLLKSLQAATSSPQKRKEEKKKVGVKNSLIPTFSRFSRDLITVPNYRIDTCHLSSDRQVCFGPLNRPPHRAHYRKPYLPPLETCKDCPPQTTKIHHGRHRQLLLRHI